MTRSPSPLALPVPAVRLNVTIFSTHGLSYTHSNNIMYGQGLPRKNIAIRPMQMHASPFFATVARTTILMIDRSLRRDVGTVIIVINPFFLENGRAATDGGGGRCFDREIEAPPRTSDAALSITTLCRLRLLIGIRFN